VAKGTVTRHPNPAVIYRVLRGPTGAVAQDQYRRALRMQAAARRFVGKDTGYLAARIEVRPYRARNDAPGFHVGVWGVGYARVHHDGNWHRQGAYIRPVRARALRFKPKGSARFIFARKVRSYRGSRFLTRALAFAKG
jgi:hypothetical protein